MLLQVGIVVNAPFRGAIGHGDFVNDPRGILIGEAIEDAYVHETSQAWLGASLTARCAKFVDNEHYIEKMTDWFDQVSNYELSEYERRCLSENRKWLVKYDVPTQSNPKTGPVIYGSLQTYAIDWTIRTLPNAAERSLSLSDDAHANSNAKQFHHF